MIRPPRNEYRKNFTAAYCLRGAAVTADQEVHRDQHDLEQHVEQEHVGGREHADHQRLLHQEQRQEAAGGAARRQLLRPDGSDHDRHQQGDQPIITSAMPSTPNDEVHAECGIQSTEEETWMRAPPGS